MSDVDETSFIDINHNYSETNIQPFKLVHNHTSFSMKSAAELKVIQVYPLLSMKFAAEFKLNHPH